MRAVYHAERKSATEHAGKLSPEGKAERGKQLGRRVEERKVGPMEGNMA